MFNSENYMNHALTLAKQGLGRVCPNPTVGCVLVKNNIVVGAGRTSDGGHPHAEANALKMAGDKVSGATAYVTLEPCAHIGNTPSCATTLVNAGIVKCYIAMLDPDARTSGKGVKILENAGIEVEIGLLKEQADIVNKGFFLKVIKNRPMFCAKIAQSIDGKISLLNGYSKWITGKQARAYGHLLRAKFDAILVGAGTVRDDDPTLDCRLLGCENQSPIRIVLGSNIDPQSKIITDNGAETHILSDDVESIAEQLANMGITRVLIEGGGKTITAFLQADLIDELSIFTAPKIMGGDSYNSIGDLSLLDMQNVAQYKCKFTKQFGEDSYTLLTKD